MMRRMHNTKSISWKYAPILLIFLIAPVILEAQDAEEEVASEKVSTPIVRSIPRIKLQEFESILVIYLRQQFRVSGMFATVQSCRLPDYGPVVTVTIQPPPYYFTRPVLLELERRQKIAEQQADRIRAQFDRTAQMVKLKVKEAELLEQMRLETLKKKAKANVSGIEEDLGKVRKTLKELELAAPMETFSLPSPDNVTEVDLNKMITENYQDLVLKLTAIMKTVLAENAASLMEEGDSRICISTTIRDNFLGNQEQNLLFLLAGSDVKEFRNGTTDLKALKEQVLVTSRKEE